MSSKHDVVLAASTLYLLLRVVPICTYVKASRLANIKRRIVKKTATQSDRFSTLIFFITFRLLSHSLGRRYFICIFLYSSTLCSLLMYIHYFFSIFVLSKSKMQKFACPYAIEWYE